MTIVYVFIAAACAAGTFAFYRPRGAFRFAAIALLMAIAAPFVLGYGLAPFVGEGAGLGVALIVYALSALAAALGLFAALGAGLRLGWNALG